MRFCAGSGCSTSLDWPAAVAKLGSFPGGWMGNAREWVLLAQLACTGF